MAADTLPTDLSDISDHLIALRKSTKRTLPVFILGLLATLFAAGVAVYFIFSLSADLEATKAELRRTQARLSETNVSLEVARQSLIGAQTAMNAAPASAQAEDSAPQLAEAIKSVTRSQSNLASAYSSLGKAEARLDNADKSTPTRPAPAASPAKWFAVVASFPASEAGLTAAMKQSDGFRAAGLCTEIWQTQISNSYALVAAAQVDQRTAVRTAGWARKQKIAADAFAQIDKGWQRLAQSAICPVAGPDAG